MSSATNIHTLVFENNIMRRKRCQLILLQQHQQRNEVSVLVKNDITVHSSTDSGRQYQAVYVKSWTFSRGHSWSWQYSNSAKWIPDL